VAVKELKILNVSKTPPFLIEDEEKVEENTRLKYRYLDLRKPGLQKNLILRHQLAREVRDYFDRLGSWRSKLRCLPSPLLKGQGIFLVPSRLSPGHFYALPQSPQLFKQILMVAGYDRYFRL